MTRRRRIVILHPAGGPPAELPDVARALEAEGAEVRLVQCGPSYERVLDEIENSDSVLVWR